MSSLHFQASSAVPPSAWVSQGHDPDFRPPVDDENLLRGGPSSLGFVAMLAAFRASGGTAPSAEVARLLRERPRGAKLNFLSLIASGEAFCFEWRGLQWVPMFQFNPFDLSLTHASQQVRAALDPDLDGWAVAAWFARPHAWLYGVRPVDLIGRNLTSVLQAARRDRHEMVPSQGELL
jgi:hypothetical protein